MKRLMILCCAAVALASCAAPKAEDPALTAIKGRISEIVGADAKIKVSAFEKMDSTTFGEEIAYRKKVQELAQQQNEKYAERYSNVGNSGKSKSKKELMKRNGEILAGLGEIEARMADSLNVVAYYDYKFSGEAVTEKGTTVFKEYWASVSPDGKVLSMESQQKGLHKSLGRVIPGYSALLEE